MKYIILYISFLLIFSKGGAQTTIILDKDDTFLSTGFMSVADASGALKFADVLSKQEKFRPLDSGSFQRDIDVYWLHLLMMNNTGVDKEWIVDFQGWSYVSAYIIKGNQIVDSSHKTGHLYPYEKRDYSVANKAYLLIPLRADSILEAYVRVQSAVNIELLPTELKLRVASRSVIDKENMQYAKVVYVFLAIFFIMIVYHLFIYISILEKSYAYYLALLVFMFLTTAINSGYIIELFSAIDSFPIWMASCERYLSILMLLFSLLFATRFLQVKRRYPAWDRIIKLIIVMLILTAIVLTFNFRLGLMIMVVPTLAIMISTITLAIKSTRDRYPSSGYFMAGYVAFVASGIPVVMAYFHFIPANVWTLSFTISIGSTLQILLFSFALTDMINVLRHENFENAKKQERYEHEQKNMQMLFDKELLKTQLEIQEQTFQNISQELHDNIGQILSVIKMNIERLSSKMYNTANGLVDETRTLLIKVINDVRDLSKTLNTEFIDQIGLPAAIQQQLNLLKRNEQYQVDLVIKGETIGYDSKRELVVFRIVQELINNIIKHSEATEILVSLDYQKDRLIIKVEDNGKGFDLVKAESAKVSLGIMNIRNRIKMINALVDFHTEPQKGTKVAIELMR